MIDFFESIYGSIKNRNNFLTYIRYYSFLRYIIRNIANFIIPIYFRLTNKNREYQINPNNKKNANRIIVSLTTFPNRINRIWLVVETMLRQSKKPDKIILYLSKLQFPGEEYLPKNLLKQKIRGLEIQFVENDIKSHKKYFYTLLQYPDDYLFTIDDDIFYRSNLIELLFNESILNPSTIIVQYGIKMAWKNNKLEPYEKWESIEYENSSASDIFFGSGGGALFPPKSFHTDVTNKELFLELCPTADDIWLNAMCKLNHFKIKKINCTSSFLPVIHKQNETLNMINNGMKQNDIQLMNVSNYYIHKLGINPFQYL